jgi:hypothetical protein
MTQCHKLLENLFDQMPLEETSLGPELWRHLRTLENRIYNQDFAAGQLF